MTGRTLAGTAVAVAGLIGVGLGAAQTAQQDKPLMAEQVFKNLKSAVEAAGGAMADIVKMNVYLVAEVGADEVPKFRAIRDRYVNTAHPPASTLVVVSRLARPGWLIEIEAVAAID